MAQLGDLIADRPISQLVIPGSHDAAMVSIQGGVDCWGVLCGTAVNQDRKIYHQLERGSRYLDLRFAWNCNSEVADWTSIHNKWGTDYRMRDILLDEVPRFIRENPKELVFVDISTTWREPEADTGDCSARGGDSHFTRQFNEICTSFVDDNEAEFIRPPNVEQTGWVRDASTRGLHALNDATGPVREGMSAWDPGGASPTLSLIPGDAAWSLYPGRFAGASTVGDIWGLPGDPQLFVTWRACADFLESSSGESSPEWDGWGAPSQGQHDGSIVTAHKLGYYANWCEKDLMFQRISRAVDKRLTGNANDQPERAFGFYNLSLASTYVTTEAAEEQGGSTACAVSPRAGYDAQEQVLDWLDDEHVVGGYRSRANLNILNGDFIEDSDLPEVAIRMNVRAAGGTTMDLGVTSDNSGNPVIELTCGGDVVGGQLLQVPEPHARLSQDSGLSGWLPLLRGGGAHGRLELAYNQYIGIPPTTMTAPDTVRVVAEHQVETDGLPSSGSSAFPGNSLTGTPRFAFTGARSETFIGTCVDHFGTTWRRTVTVNHADLEPPTIDVDACHFAEFIAGFEVVTRCTAPYEAATWTNQPVLLTPVCTDDSRGVTCPPRTTLDTEDKHAAQTFTATDAAGKRTQETFGEVWIDQTSPTVSFDLEAGGAAYSPGTWSDDPVTITPVCTDALSGIRTCPPPNTVADGIHDRQATAVDEAGNTGSASVGDIRVDTIVPAIRGEGATDQGVYAEGTWTNRPVTVTWDCADPGGSGVRSCSPPETVPTGRDMVDGRAVDVARNEATATFDVKVDTTPPTLDLTLTAGGSPYTPGSWSDTPVTMTVSCSDADSGIPVGDCPTEREFSEGVATVDEVVEDRAGNVTPRTAGPIQVDLTDPTISVSAESNGAPYTAGEWVADPVVVSFHCQDVFSAGVMSDIRSCTTPITVTSGAGPVQGTALDNAGSDATIGMDVRVDGTAPTLLATLTSGGMAYSPGSWTNQPVVVSFTCQDLESGLAGPCPDAVTLDDTAADQEVTASVSDMVGNETTITIGDIDIDRIAPTISFAGNLGIYTILDHVEISCTSTDAHSGIAVDGCTHTSRPAYEFDVGSTTFTVDSTDRAGNVGHAETTIEVVVTLDDLCTLTRQFLDGPSGQGDAMCDKLDSAAEAESDREYVHHLGNFQDHARRARDRDWFSAHQADILIRLAQSLIDQVT